MLVNRIIPLLGNLTNQEQYAPLQKHFLSQASKVSLINSLFNSIPLHSIVSCWITNKFANDISKYSKSFFWGDSSSHRKIRLLSWDHVTAPKDSGGLGVWDISIVQYAVNARRILPILNNSNFLWARILIAKYDIPDPWALDHRKISQIWQGINNTIYCVREGLRRVVGTGQHIRLLDDPWLSNIPLSKWSTFFNCDRVTDLHSVKDLCVNRTWNIQLLLDIFHLILVGKITSIHLALESDDDS